MRKDYVIQRIKDALSLMGVDYYLTGNFDMIQLISPISDLYIGVKPLTYGIQVALYSDGRIVCSANTTKSDILIGVALGRILQKMEEYM